MALQELAKFKWNPKRAAVAVMLAEGYTQKEVAQKNNVSARTVAYWLDEVEFKAEVDRLSLMLSIASRSERLRIAMRAVRARVREEAVETEKDILDWLKFAQSETDGIKLDLPSAFNAAVASLAGSGQDGSDRTDGEDSSGA